MKKLILVSLLFSMFLGTTAQTWKAQWISAVESKNDTNIWQVFRKKINLPAMPQRATAKIAVDSKYWLWVNGEMVVYEGGLKRGPNPNDTYFDVVDLSRFLKKGMNTIAILSWYWGKDGFSHKNSGKAGLVAEINADEKIFGTDQSWKSMRHPAFGKSGDPHPNFRMADDNIHFDARKDPGNWNAPDFDDSSWPQAITLGSPPVSPWNNLVERPIPLWKVEELTKYENEAQLPKISDGKSIIAALPRNLTISPYLKIKAPAGLTIDMRTDNYKGGSEYNYRSEYITKEGVQEFESLAYLNGHWMIYTIPTGVEILELRYRETRYNTEFTGSFDCDDPFLNSLWIKCRNTMNVNMRDGIQDPDRERAQWWGDVAILLGEILHSCDKNAPALIKKAILNLVDWQKPDGVLYSPVPAGSWDKELPGQMLSSVGMFGFWYYYFYTGDIATIRYAYPAVKRYLDLWQLGPNGLLEHRDGGWDWGDWGENIDRPVMDNALLYQALESAINMAKLTGNETDIPHYESMRKSISANYNRVLWTGNEYRSPGYTGITDDRGHGLAVLAGLAKQAQYPAIKKVFERSFNASPYMEKYILESIFRMGDANTALARMKSRYQKMVESPLSTLWEGWGIGSEGYGGGSYNHGWSGGPLTLLMEYVCGITPTEPGFSRFQVMPQPGSLNMAAASFETVKGTIRSSFQKLTKGMEIKVTVPASTQAIVGIPAYGVKTIKLNGKLLWKNGKYLNAAVPSSKLWQDRIGFEVSSGEWSFLAEN
ncbi:MAG: alpha-L-rhamnosidase C-terminal domain-containing protein [Mariniphaga sp.]